MFYGYCGFGGPIPIKNEKILNKKIQYIVYQNSNNPATSEK